MLFIWEFAQSEQGRWIMFLARSKILTLAFVLFSGLYFSSLEPPAEACTGIMLRNTDGSIVHGRTLEFGMVVDTMLAIVPRGYEFVGKAPDGAGMKYKAKYAAMGAIPFNDVAISDGMNEKGLAVGAFYFPTFAKYAEATNDNRSKALSPVDFPNW